MLSRGIKRIYSNHHPPQHFVIKKLPKPKKPKKPKKP